MQSLDEPKPLTRWQLTQLGIVLGTALLVLIWASVELLRSPPVEPGADWSNQAETQRQYLTEYPPAAIQGNPTSTEIDINDLSVVTDSRIDGSITSVARSLIISGDITTGSTPAWTTLTGDSGISKYFADSAPNTITFMLGDAGACGYLKCDGQRLTFTGDLDESAAAFVETVNHLLGTQNVPQE